MTDPAQSQALPPPLNSGVVDGVSDPVPPPPVVTPPEPARDEVLIVAVVTAGAMALFAVVLAWGVWRRARRRRG